jgi:tetratricopeptide (TPR) repeat protein
MKIALTLMILIAMTGPARAQQGDGDAEGALEAATAAFGLGHYGEAAEAYERAYRLHADAALLYNAAQAHRMAGESARALELYRGYLRTYRHGANRAEAARHVENLERHAGEKAAERPRAEKAAEKTPPPAEPTPPPVPPVPTLTRLPEPERAPAMIEANDPAPAPERPLTSRGWFWVAMGGALAVAAAAVVIGVAVAGAKSPHPSLGRVGN